MKYISIFLLLFFIIGGGKSLYSQTIIQRIDTTIISPYRVMEINNSAFKDSIDSIILKNNYHQREEFQDFIYSIFIKKDTLDNRLDIYISLFPLYDIERIAPKGIINLRNAIFTIDGDYKELFSYTNRCECIKYKKNIGYSKNGVFHEDFNIPDFYDAPIWIFTFQNGILKLFHKELILSDP